MKQTFVYLIIFLALCAGTMSCGDDAVADEQTTNENIFRSPDYEDSAEDDGTISYEDQSTQSAYTDKTSDPTTDPQKDGKRGNWVDSIRYTDDEYEAAYSTSSTNPKNQIHKLPKKKE